VGGFLKASVCPSFDLIKANINNGQTNPNIVALNKLADRELHVATINNINFVDRMRSYSRFANENVESTYISATNYLNDDAHLHSEMSPEIKNNSNTEHSIYNGINCTINWQNLGNGKSFHGNRIPIKECIASFLHDKSDVERIFGGIGFNLSYNDISSVYFHHLATSERSVFKVTIFSSIGQQLAEAAAKYVDSSEKMERADYFHFLKKTELVPEFGGWHNNIYFEEWIKGPTVQKLGSERPLCSIEIENISENWVRIWSNAALYKAYNYRRIDMNAKNIMYKNSTGLPDFVVVDIFSGRIGGNTPARILYDIIKTYVLDNNIWVRSENPNDVFPVLRGINKGFAYDRITTREFLVNALNENMLAIKVLHMEADIREYIKNELGE